MFLEKNLVSLRYFTNMSCTGILACLVLCACIFSSCSMLRVLIIQYIRLQLHVVSKIKTCATCVLRFVFDVPPSDTISHCICHSIMFQGIARKLVKAALQVAAKKREMRYSDLTKIDRGVRRHFHDDITVIVLFLDPNLISQNFHHGPVVSLKGAGVPV